MNADEGSAGPSPPVADSSAPSTPATPAPSTSEEATKDPEDADEESLHEAPTAHEARIDRADGVDGDEEPEVVELNVGKRPHHGQVWKNPRNGEYLKYHCSTSQIDYAPGDAVYIESHRPDQPYFICQIQDLKMSKRDTLMVHIKWFYRTSEVPEQVYQLLIQDRHIEAAGSRRLLNEAMYRTRELFISEMTDIYPASVLRGKCVVHHCMDLKALKEFQPEDDVFFYTLSYNPETRRLASTQGEIRVGASHQAKLPEFKGEVALEKRPEPWGEEITWCPERIHDHDLLMFLRAARSMAAFAAMCDGGSPQDGISAASRDGITAQAIQTLHESNYDTAKALQSLLKTPFPEEIFRRWHEEEVKSFIKGLRLHGKNFFKIRSEFLPEKDTAELIEFYYFWKKTTGAANNRPRGRRHRPAVMRRIKGTKSINKTSNDDPTDLSSCSETEENGEAAPGKEPAADEMSPYYCRHCFATSSKDWHHGGKEKLLLCLDCRIYFKRYAELPNLDGQKVIGEEEEEEDEDEEEEEEEMEEEPEIEVPMDVKKEEETEDVLEPPHAPTPLADDNSKLGDELNLSAIEQDSKVALEPVDLKAEPPQRPPASPAPAPALVEPPITHAPPTPVAAFHPPPPAHSNNEVQVLSERPASRGGPSNGPGQPHPQHAPPPAHTPQPPPPPRKDTPPPKPDGSECHRSQSAIFTRIWNRGEGNSCSRTDMIFKPVPDSKLARKREERIRKANEREEALKVEAVKRSHMEIPGVHHPAHPFFNDHMGKGSPHHRSPFPPGHPMSEMERRENELRMSMGAPPVSRAQSMYPPGFGPAPPPNSHPSLMQAAAESRRFEEQMARASAERQYAERMNALATDPLVRLQMAGVTPEIPGPFHPSHYGPLGPLGHGQSQGMSRPPSALDPRFRSPADMLMRSGGYHIPASHEMLQRQLLLEREHSILAAHQSAAAAHMAQQEELYRMEHARQAAANRQ
eukprot:maker-scaffold907_size82601-snap-gene-0.22 protein:Tk01568 transcript:maker-scaffold907_size82601-snap-gene-0.22-mRNA-1 annotation:"arginine-glutamic acid dipeptide repeats protein"